MKKYLLRLCGGALAACLLLTGCGQKLPKLNPSNPVPISIWHYYNGPQKDAFSTLVNEFNETEGKEKGIVVQEFSQQGVTELADGVLAAAQNKPGAGEMPNIFSAYADTAFAADALGVVADLSPYLTAEEQATYVEGYLDEGRFSGNDSLKIFPVAKSLEILMLNQTDWQPFAQATGLTAENAFATIESLTETAELYYEWSDEQTPNVPNDGKALFGRDAFANYMIIGARQLGTELIAVEDGVPVLNFDKATVRKLWDNYYVPMVSGWFAAENRFRSDDIKVGTILSCVGSSSGATFFPKEVVVDDTHSYSIDTMVLPAPQFAEGEPYAVQQGAGMVVTTGSPEEVYASVIFLKWFTDPARNFTFSMGSGYLPVTKEASALSFADTTMEAAGVDARMRDIIDTSLTTTNSNTLYTTKAFAGGSAVRNILETSMPEKAAADRQAAAAEIAAGADRDTVLAGYFTDENFDAWYEDTLQQITVLMQ